MPEGWKQHWLEFKHSRPGQRFQDRYERKRSAGSQRSTFRRVFKPLAGCLLIIAGIVFCVVPGPGLPLLAFGACLLADVSRSVAVVLDRIELSIRSLITRIRRALKRAG
ncbi:MAG: hypothetical protein EOP83_07735 [Verrucomicrobiaceae bacterium]|nr:MAG: hypothetical protein EOP83_07735 [Verrucomicrobiaceae bacterium]